MSNLQHLRASRAVARRLAGALTILFVVLGTQASAQSLVGTPVNSGQNFELGADLGFGHLYSRSLGSNFQDWGAQIVSGTDGFPVRFGDQSIRFETREGVCGWDDQVWSDCTNGRSRHELSSARDRDPWNVDTWYSVSIYVPQDFGTPDNIKTSIFQFWSGGKDSWMFKFEPDRGFYVQRKIDNTDTVIVPASQVSEQWVDYVLRLRHSMDNDGILTLWADGEPVYQYAGRTALGDNRDQAPYFKFGLYNTAMGADGAPVGPDGYGDGEGLPDLHIFFDEVRYGRSCKALKLGDLGYDCADFSAEEAEPSQITALQKALNALGCNVGAEDGILGARTMAAAMECRHFDPGTLPGVLTEASLPTFIALYSAEGAQALPTEGLVLDSALSELVGGNSDNALSVKARSGELGLDFILIGHFSDEGRTDWLSILFTDNLTSAEADAVLQCPNVNVQNWGDGSHHAEIRFIQDTPASWVYGSADCLSDKLPADTFGEVNYLLENMRSVAAEIASGGFNGVAHEGLTRFIEMTATGEVRLAGT